MLTKRELEVLQLRKSGKTQADVAKHLKISQPAVSTFERNAHRKIAAAEDLLKHLKDLGLLALALLFLPLLATNAHATVPTPGHPASGIGPGTFSSGNYVFPAQLDITGNLIVNTSKFYVNANSGNVGIGTAVPNSTLHVIGTANISGAVTLPNSICTTGQVLTTTTAGTLQCTADASAGNVTSSNGTGSYVARWTNSTNLVAGAIYDNASHVGIKTATPGYTLDVNGDGHFVGNLVVNSTRFIVNASSGRVGIGTMSPGYSLDVTGTGRFTTGLTAATLNSGLGDYELYAMDQDVQTTNAVTFGTITSSGTFIVNNTVFYVNSGTGRIGINTNAPRASLEVNGTFLLTNASGAVIMNYSNEITDANILRFGSITSNVTITVNGSINATGTIQQSAGFDLAETFSAAGPLSAGDLVSIAGPKTVKQATKADADLVIGAVSTKPGFIIGDPKAVNPTLIGLAGRIPVKVIGQIAAGDFIAVSDTPGTGEKATSAGFVIGRAIEDSVNGFVMIIIQPTYFNPAVKSDGTIVGGSSTKAVFVDQSEAGQAAKLSNPAAVQQSIDAAVQQAVADLNVSPTPSNNTNITVQDVTTGTLQTDIISSQSGKDVVIQLG